MLNGSSIFESLNLTFMMNNTYENLNIENSIELFNDRVHDVLKKCNDGYHDVRSHLNQIMSRSSEEHKKTFKKALTWSTDERNPYYNHLPFLAKHIGVPIYNNYMVGPLVDAFFACFNPIFNIAGKQMIPETSKFLNPLNINTLINNPEIAKKCLDQRIRLLTNPISFIMDPKSYFKAYWDEQFGNGAKHVGHMGKSFMMSKQTKEQLVIDLSGPLIAEKLGVLLACSCLFKLPGPRQNTKSMYEKLYPDGNTRFKYLSKADFWLTKPFTFILKRKIARIRGNPLLTSVVMGYLITMSTAKNIQDREDLMTKYPDVCKHLEKMNLDTICPGINMDFYKSLESKK